MNMQFVQSIQSVYKPLYFYCEYKSGLFNVHKKAQKIKLAEQVKYRVRNYHGKIKTNKTHFP